MPGSNQILNTDSRKIDLRDAASFDGDIVSVAALLNHFLHALPDPLFTSDPEIDDDVSRRISLHAVINSLPDPHYATLRVLALHLARVADHSDLNKMSTMNLAPFFGPALLGEGSGGEILETACIGDTPWRVRVLETLLNNVSEIFDDYD